MTGDTGWDERARSIFRAFAGSIASMPSAHTQMLSALHFAIGPAREIVIASEDGDAEAAEMAREATRRFLPESVVLWNLPSESEMLRAFAPFAAGQAPAGGRATVYVCENFACRAPVTGMRGLEDALAAAGPPPSAPTRAGSS
jgi:uncharacterized protein YyaL (SSP411 family)